MAKRKPKDGPKNGTELIPQSHGGALWSKGPPPETQVPGTGRPPSKVKAALRKDFDERRALLTDIADGVVRTRFVGTCPDCGYEADSLDPDEVDLAEKAAPSFSDRLKAMDVIGKYSDLNEAKNIDAGLIQRLALVTRPYLSEELDPSALEEEWLGVIADWLG